MPEKNVYRVCFESPFTRMVSSLKYKCPPDCTCKEMDTIVAAFLHLILFSSKPVHTLSSHIFIPISPSLASPICEKYIFNLQQSLISLSKQHSSITEECINEKVLHQRITSLSKVESFIKLVFS